MFAIPNGGGRGKPFITRSGKKRPPLTAVKLRAEGLKAGVPDLCLPVARGNYHSCYIEMKDETASGASLSDSQIVMHKKLIAQGNFVKTCWNADEAIVTLSDYLNGRYERGVPERKTSCATNSIPFLSLAYGQTCDDSLLSKHTYKPQRLIVKQPCIAVTGTIVDATKGKRKDGVRKDSDGDTHGWLKVDPQFENLLNAGNFSAEDGNLVFEIVCKFPVKQKDAKAACLDYQSSIVIPPVGSHVQIVGAYVEEKNHKKWREIHPVTSIDLITSNPK